jgi:lipopolysaccharide/colanic/teichoic acid biosynthesis glycosyltransferase
MELLFLLAGENLMTQTPMTSPELLVGEVHFSVYDPTKRVIDILGACIGLLLTSALFPVIALMIRLDSPGPILYAQERVGVSGRRFRMLKFRSMITDADAKQHLVANASPDGLLFKNPADPRVTRIGRFLRRTSLDELPQFWNVLRGEMSLVGTRPPRPQEVERYSPTHWIRLAVKPGITGLWQVSGRSEILDFEQVVALDRRYQAQWCLVLDLQIIWKTVLTIVTGRGAC